VRMDQLPTFDLLRTKLYRPRLAEDFIPRPRLLARLGRAAERKLVLITAPPGYGKTALIAGWLRDSAVPTAWLSLGEGDNALSIFLSYIIAALRTVFPDACPRTGSLLQSQQNPPVAEFSTTLINEIDALAQPCVLVLDDYHLITDPVLHDFVTRLIDHQPPELHLILIARDSPPLPLARWRARHDLLEIRTADLRFSRDEAAQFLEKAVNQPIAPETVEALEDSTEGWIVGLRLAALSLHRQADQAKFIEAFQRAGLSDVRDYLLDEVLRRQAPALQDFLIKTALLDRFCVELCNTLLPQPEAAGFIAELTRANLFIVPLDDRDEWFRYHHLFSEMLRQRAAQRLSADTISALHRRASDWLAAHDLLDEAIQHAFAAGDTHAAALIVEVNFSRYLDRNHQAILASWLARLPEHLIADRPRLLIAQSWIYSFRDTHDLIPALLERAEALLRVDAGEFDATQTRALRGYIAAQRSQLASMRSDVPQMLSESAHALSDLPTDALYVRGSAATYYALALCLSGQRAEAERFLWHEVDSHPGKTTYLAHLLVALCSIYADATAIDRLWETAQRLRYLADQADLSLMRGWALYFSGHARYAQNELSSASEQFTQAIQLNYVAHRQTIYLSRVGLTLVHHAQQRYAEAAADLEELTQLYPEVASDLASLRAQLAWQQGELEPALRWAANFKFELPPDPLGWLPVPHLAFIWIQIAAGTAERLQVADTRLAELRQHAQAQHNVFHTISAQATQAWSLSVQGRKAEALSLLEEAVKLAWPGGHVRVFVDLGSAVRDLLQQLRARGVTPHYLDRVLAAMPAAFSIESRPSTAAAASAVDLTWREMEVLRLLAQHLTNQEIAAQLVVTPVAVKKHLGRIYRKLGVDNRRAALARAEELKLL
jgi:LuxR family maltose regulon positive regulatory protein